jgi:hypothetical protein
MIGYHDYKALHLVGLLFFLMALTRFHTAANVGRFFKSFLYSSAAVTFSTGTVMMYRFGLHESIPLWIWMKYLTTLMLILSLWLPRPGSKLNPLRPWGVYLLVVVAVYCSVYKPF